MSDAHARSAGIQNLAATIGLQIVNDNTTLLAEQGFCISSSNPECSPQGPIRGVPAPGSLALLGLGLTVLGALARRPR